MDLLKLIENYLKPAELKHQSIQIPAELKEFGIFEILKIAKRLYNSTAIRKGMSLKYEYKHLTASKDCNI